MSSSKKFTGVVKNRGQYKVSEWNAGIYEVLDPNNNCIAAYDDKVIADDLCGYLNSPHRIDVA